MRKKTSGKIDPSLETAINKLLKEVMADKTATLKDKLEVFDRRLKLEALKLKEDPEEWGSGFREEGAGNESE